MKPPRLVVLAILMVALAIGAHPAGAQPKAAADRTGPLDLVKASVSRVLAIVQPPRIVVSDGGQRRTDIRRVAQGLFDFNEMARLTLARHWKDRSAQEPEEFVPLFTDLLERSYLTTIENYAGEKITFLGESVSGPYTRRYDPGSPPSGGWRFRSSTVCSRAVRDGRCTTWCWTA